MAPPVDPAPVEPAGDYQLVPAPRHVRAVKAAVEGLRERWPWLFGALQPLKARLSARYYGWINRHERVPRSVSPMTSPVTQPVTSPVTPPEALNGHPSELEQATPEGAPHLNGVSSEAPAATRGPTPTQAPQPPPDDDAAAPDAAGSDAPEPSPVSAPAPSEAPCRPAARTRSRTVPRTRSGTHPEPAITRNGVSIVPPPPAAAAPPATAPERPRRQPPSPERRFAEHRERMVDAAEARRRWDGRAADITMVIGTLGPGGAERQLLTLASEMQRRGRGACRAITIRDPVGHDGHHLRALAAAAELHRTLPVEVARAEAILSEDGLGFVSSVLHPELLWDVPQLLAKFRRLDPLVVHAWLDWSSLVAGFAATLLPVPCVVLSTRNVAPRNFPSLDRPYLRDMYRLLLQDPRVRIINNSNAGADDYAEWLEFPRERICVVRNGVDAQTFAPAAPASVAAMRRELGVEESARLVTGVFRLAEEKQPMVFIEAAERVLAVDPSAVVVHAGSGELAESVRCRVAGSPFASRFRLLGRRHDIPALLSASDVCVLTSRKEGTPNVLIEAQLLGCPVVATRAGGAPETFENGRSGILCEVGDSAAIADAVRRILADDPLRRSMAEAARALASSRFSVQRMADETMALYG